MFVCYVGIQTADCYRLLDLFSRLRELRGNKTMIFSTHRFGNLTRHADLILYVLPVLFVRVDFFDR
jgi:hypothetical protein